MPSPHFTLGTFSYKAPVSALTQAHGHQIVAAEGSQQSHVFLEITKENCKNLCGWVSTPGSVPAAAHSSSEASVEVTAHTVISMDVLTSTNPDIFPKLCINSPKTFLRSRFGLAPSPIFQKHCSSQGLSKLGLLAFRLMKKRPFSPLVARSHGFSLGTPGAG